MTPPPGPCCRCGWPAGPGVAYDSQARGWFCSNARECSLRIGRKRRNADAAARFGAGRLEAPALWVLSWFHREPRPLRRPDGTRPSSTGWTRGREVRLLEADAVALFDLHLAAALEHAEGDGDLVCSQVVLQRLEPRADLPLLELLAGALAATDPHHLATPAWATATTARAWHGVSDPERRRIDRAP